MACFQLPFVALQPFNCSSPVYLLMNKAEIDTKLVPDHVAVIMDGNGRWAKQKGKNRLFGHHNGVKAVRETIEAAAEIGVKHVTLYAFSTENWDRPKDEINGLMELLVFTINKEIKDIDGERYITSCHW